MFNLDSKTALITGAASGIGEAIAYVLSSAGARVIVADVNCPDGERVAQRCAMTHQSAHFIPLDVTDEGSCIAVADAVQSQHGALDILINNAGIGHVGTIQATDGTDLDRLYAVNVRGVFNVTKAFIGEMLRRRVGVIVNIASIGGVLAIRDRLAYCTTKFAGLLQTILFEGPSEHLMISPPLVETRSLTVKFSDFEA